MTPLEQLRQALDLLPPGSAVVLPRERLLEAIGSALQTSADLPVGDLTCGEAGQRFRRSPITIRQWCEAGRFEGAYKLNGTAWRIPLVAIEAFVHEQRGAPPGARGARRRAAKMGAWRKVRGRP